MYSRCLENKNDGTAAAQGQAGIKEEYFVALNFSVDPQEITLPRQTGEIILSTFFSQKEFLGGKLILRGNEGVIIKTSVT